MAFANANHMAMVKLLVKDNHGESCHGSLASNRTAAKQACGFMAMCSATVKSPSPEAALVMPVPGLPPRPFATRQ